MTGRAPVATRILSPVTSFPLASLTGKWKMSQNRSAADREGVAAGLTRESPDVRR